MLLPLFSIHAAGHREASLAEVMRGQVPGLVAQVTGTGEFDGESIFVSLTNDTGERWIVEVPVGMSLVPHNFVIQTMYTAGGERLEAGPGTTGHTVVAFCGEKNDDIPDYDTVFSPGEPAAGDLLRLLLELNRRREFEDYGIYAVWHLTDGLDLGEVPEAQAVVDYVLEEQPYSALPVDPPEPTEESAEYPEQTEESAETTGSIDTDGSDESEGAIPVEKPYTPPGRDDSEATGAPDGSGIMGLAVLTALAAGGGLLWYLLARRGRPSPQAASPYEENAAIPAAPPASETDPDEPDRCGCGAPLAEGERLCSMCRDFVEEPAAEQPVAERTEVGESADAGAAVSDAPLGVTSRVRLDASGLPVLDEENAPVWEYRRLGLNGSPVLDGEGRAKWDDEEAAREWNRELEQRRSRLESGSDADDEDWEEEESLETPKGSAPRRRGKSTLPKDKRKAGDIEINLGGWSIEHRSDERSGRQVRIVREDLHSKRDESVQVERGPGGRIRGARYKQEGGKLRGLELGEDRQEAELPEATIRHERGEEGHTYSVELGDKKGGRRSFQAAEVGPKRQRVLYRDTVLGHRETEDGHRLSLSQTGAKKEELRLKSFDIGSRHQSVEVDGAKITHTGRGPDEIYKLELTGRNAPLRELVYGESRARLRVRDLLLERVGDKYRLAKGHDTFGKVFTELGYGEDWARIRMRRPLESLRFLGDTADVSVHLERWRDGATPWKGIPGGEAGGDFAEVGLHWRHLGVSVRRLPTGEVEKMLDMTLFKRRF
jgi:hypothetical protein